jgi:hypothetical protein
MKLRMVDIQVLRELGYKESYSSAYFFKSKHEPTPKDMYPLKHIKTTSVFIDVKTREITFEGVRKYEDDLITELVQNGLDVLYDNYCEAEIKEWREGVRSLDKIRVINVGKIRGLMAEANEKQYTLANLLNLSGTGLRKKLEGTSDFTATELKVMSEHYNVKVDYFFYDSCN